MSSLSSRHPLRLLALLAFAAVIAASPALRAQDDNSDNNGDNGDNGGGENAKGGPSITDKTRTAFIKLKPLLAAKDYDGVLALLDSLVPTVKPDSYDLSVILDTKAKILWQGKSSPQLAIEPWEQLLALVDRHPEYLEPADRINHYQYLAQTYYLVASDPKFKNPVLKQQYFERALAYMKRWLQETPKPRQEDLLFYTSLLYQKAVENPKEPDRAYMDMAKTQAQKALLTDPRPKEQFYMLLVAIAQQEGQFDLATQYLELLVSKHPTTKDYWMQLVGNYTNLAGTSANNPEQQRSYYARAINAVEHAQRLGFLNTPKDNFNLVSLYDQVGQFGKAIDLLYGGMKSGKIESTLKNWQALAYFYQQIDEPEQAIKVLKEAEQTPEFAAGGEIDRQIAELYYQLDNTQGVYDYCNKAVEKGNHVKNGYTTYQLLAYAAYELRKYPEALKACDEAMKSPEAPRSDLARLKEGIQDAIKQQEQEKAAAESERRSL